ncbi:hypothetical protein GCM10029963_45650 [Micromonospora andamanensis]|nr:hypothetical protein Vwe01_46840 [Micromonospora andamanensis]
MSPRDAESFADAVLQRCAELLYAEMKPQIDKTAADCQRERRRPRRPATGSTAGRTASTSGATVVSLAAFRTRKAAA